jgi:carboxyl-terminal processing protease
LKQAFAARDRREFDMATLEWVAKLHNGHTGFWDEWLSNKYGQPLGFQVSVVRGKWVVRDTRLPDLKIGDVIEQLNDSPVDVLFQTQRKYISTSSDTQARNALFYLPYLFPERFTINVEGGRTVEIDREHQKLLPRGPQKTQGKLLASGKVGYIRIPSFSDPELESDALKFVKEYGKLAAIVIDVRQNGGGSTPSGLIAALMNRSYREWAESTPIQIGIVNWQLGSASHPTYHIPSDPDQPDASAYQGKVVLLVDDGCGSACEDFVVPFKDNQRAVLVGATTTGSSGQPYFIRFPNGMSFHVSTKRESFPDGKQFEGVGIKPDVELEPSIDDLRNGKDPVLEKALEIALQPGTVR